MKPYLTKKDSTEISGKFNNSSNDFRNFISSIRKNQNQNINEDDLSDINPENSIKLSRQMFFSQSNSVQRLSQSRYNNHHFKIKVQENDDCLKLKPRGTVGLRYKIVKKSLNIQREYMGNSLTKNLEPQRTRNMNIILPLQINKDKLIADSEIQIEGSKNVFIQNKLNKYMRKNKDFEKINQRQVIKFCLEQQLTSNSQANQIFQFFSSLCNRIHIVIQEPFIKKYSNSIYFGFPFLIDAKYYGFIYYFNHKIYYGQLLNSRPHGNGVDINYQSSIVYKGVFDQGKKTGKFEVSKPGQIYIGSLLNGQYDGKGKLTTNNSVYEGYFEHGEKHGYGLQLFMKSGMRLSGMFYHGYFDTKNQSSCPSMNFKKNSLNKINKLEIQNDNLSIDQSWKQGFIEGLQTGQKTFNNKMKDKLRLSQLHNSLFSRLTNKKKERFQQQKEDFEQLQISDYFNKEDIRDEMNPIEFSITEQRKKGLSKKLSMISERQETNQFEDPLPMPTFMNKR